MAEEIETIAQLLGAKIVGQVPDVGGGAFAAMHLARFYQDRMGVIHSTKTAQAQEKPPTHTIEVPVSDATAKAP